jgi:dihydrofolate reductase
MISIIAALTRNRVIGRENALPWNDAEEMAHFKKCTQRKTMVMGRKTFESIRRPLLNRNYIVVSTKMKKREGIDVCQTLSAGLKKARSYKKEICVIGGTTIFEKTIPIADRMLLSIMKKEYKGDTYFPNFSEKEWTIAHRKKHRTFEFRIYQRVKKKKKNAFAA